MDFPDCCKDCQNFDSTYSEMSDINYYYCVLNIWWPYKKQTCKKQRLYPYQCSVCYAKEGDIHLASCPAGLGIVKESPTQKRPDRCCSTCKFNPKHGLCVVPMEECGMLDRESWEPKGK